MNHKTKSQLILKSMGIALILGASSGVLTGQSRVAVQTNKTTASTHKTAPELDQVQIYEANVRNSIIYWKGEKLTGAHTGTLALTEGRIQAVKGQPTSAVLYMDMKSIANTDIENPEYRKKLEDHLRSEDFFYSEKYPVAIFKTTLIETLSGAKASDPNYMVHGNLTIKGMTHAISFPARILVEDSKVQAMGKLSFDRSKWNIRYGSKSFFEGLGDNAIYDDIQINFNLIASPAGS